MFLFSYPHKGRIQDIGKEGISLNDEEEYDVSIIADQMASVGYNIL